MKKLPIGIQTFSKIIEGNYVYADKTEHIYKLINEENCCFLSRPRRFGKSLLLDTIREVFLGNKEMFRGLWIYNSDYDFAAYPVIRLDMSAIANESAEILKSSLASDLKKRIKEENLDITDEIPSELFKNLIEGLHKKYGQRVVVLIDEYDKPILDHINEPQKAEANRAVIRGFYGILKPMDEHLRFVFITGVSKFTKTSLFSGLNNLTDITMMKRYANICGIPVESLDEYFGEHIESLRDDDWFKDCEKTTDIKEQILWWYDGYSWDGKTRLLNPFSLLSFFSHERFHSFWYASGSPKFLLDYIKRQPETYVNLKNCEITEAMLDSVDIDKIKVEPLLFQTGYLTIKEIPPPVPYSSPVYVVDIPNFEVREAFDLHILSALTESGDVKTGRAKLDIGRALQAGELQKMLEVLRGLFASIPYQLHIEAEAYYHSIFYAVLNVLGFDIEAEVSTSRGRVDAALETSDKVYVMEFKYAKCPPNAGDEEKSALFSRTLAEGMKQIDERGYCKRYAGSGKTVYKAAFAFLGRDEIEMKTITHRKTFE